MDDTGRDVVDLSNDSVGMDADESKNKEKKVARRGVDQRKLAEENIKAIEQRIDGLEYAIKRINEADDDQLVIQELEGGISVEVPSDEREDVCQKMEQARDQLQSRLDNLDAIVETG